MPRGERGEIVVTGRDLAAGYWRNEALTAEKFSGASHGGMRTFRTGDMGRFRPDGMLEHLGRNDARLKIRGFRVDPSEVEGFLRKMDEVEQVVVTGVEGPNGTMHLAAFVVLKSGERITASDFRRRLRQVLPDHMIPSGFEFLKRLPLTPHSKVDRAALRKLYVDRRRGRTGDEATNSTEKLIADVWCEVFEVADVGRSDDFFDLGGDSLSAAITAARVFERLGVEIDLALFAKHPVLSDLAGAVEAMRRADAPAALPPIVPVPRDRPLPLTYVQERIWRLCQTPEVNVRYTMGRTHRIRGRLDIEAMRDCLTYLVQRHEILRTSFAVVDGAPVQVVDPEGIVQLDVVDLSDRPDVDQELVRIAEEENRRPFDIGQLPLFRFQIVRIRKDEHVLARTAHHLIGDGQSWRRFHREFALLYEAKAAGDAPPLPDSAPIQYGDYAAWQRAVLHPDGPLYRETVAWWRERLSRVQRPPEFSFRRPNPVSGVDPREGFFIWGLDEDATAALHRLAVETGTTFFAVRLAAYVAQLCEDGGVSDIAVGIYFGTRSMLARQDVLGLFANLATPVFRYEPNLSFRQWIAAVQAVVLDAEAHGDLPYEMLCSELAAAGAAPVELRAIVNKAADHGDDRFANLTLEWERPASREMPWGISIGIDDRIAANCIVLFDAGMYDPALVRAFIDRFRRLLENGAREPERSLRELMAPAASAQVSTVA